MVRRGTRQSADCSGHVAGGWRRVGTAVRTRPGVWLAARPWTARPGRGRARDPFRQAPSGAGTRRPTSLGGAANGFCPLTGRWLPPSVVARERLWGPGGLDGTDEESDADRDASRPARLGGDRDAGRPGRGPVAPDSQGRPVQLHRMSGRAAARAPGPRVLLQPPSRPTGEDHVAAARPPGAAERSRLLAGHADGSTRSGMRSGARGPGHAVRDTRSGARGPGHEVRDTRSGMPPAVPQHRRGRCSALLCATPTHGEGAGHRPGWCPGPSWTSAPPLAVPRAVGGSGRRQHRRGRCRGACGAPAGVRAQPAVTSIRTSLPSQRLASGQ